MATAHGEITSVIESGDENRAAELAAEHVRTSYVRVISAYEGDAAAETDGRKD